MLRMTYAFRATRGISGARVREPADAFLIRWRTAPVGLSTKLGCISKALGKADSVSREKKGLWSSGSIVM